MREADLTGLSCRPYFAVETFGVEHLTKGVHVALVPRLNGGPHDFTFSCDIAYYAELQADR